MENKNYGLLLTKPRPTDYIFGGNSPITVARFIPDWSKYLPDNETQRNNIVDFLDCASMSAKHAALEMQLNYFLATKQLSDEALNFYTDNGYIVNGKFKLSVRYNAVMNGTAARQGNDLLTVAEHLQADGFLPLSDLPMTLSMTWSEFYAPVPQALIDKARKALWFLKIQYQWVSQEEIPNALKTSPIQIASEVCAGWDSGQVVAKCSNQPLQHATVVYGINVLGNYEDFDHYAPYQQLLAHDYELPLNLQYVCSLKPTMLRNGMRGDNVVVLQQNLNKVGYQLTTDGKFGPLTAQVVIDFQGRYNLSKDGIAGPLTLSALEIEAQKSHISRIDDFCKAIAQYEGANPQLDNPGDLEFHSQQFAIKDGRWAKFDTYEHGYDALKDLITRACEGKIIAYNEDGTIYDFFCIYSPSSDSNNPLAYADFVGQRLSVDAETFIIKDLL